jgi:23S rRNA (cytosine1962-C5)-methyltransferase
MTNDYQLLDFGGGRRLERFGEIVLDRPCPTAEGFERADPEAWQRADARFEGRNEEKGEWTDRRTLPERWTVGIGQLRFELKRTDFGHLGLFPEQAENWKWIKEQIEGRNEGGDKEKAFPSAPSPHPLPLSQRERGDIGDSAPSPHPLPLSQRERGDAVQVLNLFAYTGGSTLAAAAAGAEVVHVDAAKNVVAWARRNAELSGLSNAPIRWIAEDAMKFVKREIHRGNRYDAVILDPPSYGHGPRAEVWRLSKHLPRLLSLCSELTEGRPQFMLLTCHTPGYDTTTLRQMMGEAFDHTKDISAGTLSIRSTSGVELPCGIFVRNCKRLISNP